MLSDPNLEKLPTGWKRVRLGDVSEVVSGATPKTNVDEYWNGDIVWITPTDLSRLANPHINSSQRRLTEAGYASCSTKLVPKGAVVMSTRAPIGHLGIADVELCVNQGCKIFVPSPGVDSKFLYFSLLACVGDIQALGSGTTFTEVSKTKLSQFEIPLPPLAEQRRIVARLNAQMAVVERAKRAAREILDAADALNSAIFRDFLP